MKISIPIAMLWALAVVQNAGAIQLVGEPSQPAAVSSQTVRSEREGIIGKIDLDGRNMVVNGVSYSFSIAALSVHGASLLTLKKNDRIRFKVSSESGKERITEIWLISVAQH